jgi:oligosaccharide repeat unit polymerase
MTSPNITKITVPKTAVLLIVSLGVGISLLFALAAMGTVGFAGAVLNHLSLQSILLLVIATVIFYATDMPPTAKRIFSPCGFVFWSYIGFIFLGITNYYATYRYLFDYYEIDFKVGSYCLSLGLLAIVLGMWFGSKLGIGRVFPGKRCRAIDLSKLFMILLPATIVVLLGNLYIYHKIGGVPVFVGIQKEDIYSEGGFGRITRVIHLAVVLQILWYFLLLMSKDRVKKSISAACLVVLITIMFGYGSRFYFLLPLFFFLFFVSRRLSMRKFLAVTTLSVVPLAFISAAVINLRGGEDVALGNAYVLVASRIGVRARDFYVLVDYFRDLEGVLSGYSLLPMITNFVPAPLWTAIGLQKSQYTISGGMFLRDYFNVPFFVNTGIVGEFFLNGGVWLMVIGLFLYGLVLFLLYSAWLRAASDSISSLVFGYLLSNLALSLTAGHFYGLSFWSYQYGLLLVLVGLIARRTGPSLSFLLMERALYQ